MKLFFLCIIYFGFVIATFAQINVIKPNWVVVNDSKQIAAINKNEVQDGYYYVLVDEQYNQSKKQFFVHYAVSALTPEALTNVSQLEFTYDPSYEKAEIHSVKIIRGVEIIDKTKDLSVKVLNEERQRNNGILNSNKTLFINLSDVRVGDVLDYSYSITGRNPILSNYFNCYFSLSYSVPVGKVYYRLLTDKTDSLSFVYLNTIKKPIFSEKNGLSEYIWEIVNPHVTHTESSTPYWYNPYATVQVSNIKSWTKVKQHCSSLFKLPSYNQQKLKTIIDSITKEATTKEAQITALINFVQRDIRYSGNENGIYSHVPRDPNFVLNNRYGDCKEKSVLLNELLKQIGINAYPVLLNTNLGKTIKNQVPSINAFNHCISTFEFNKKRYFIDPTISYQRGHFKFRILPNYEYGMILNNESENFTEIIPDLSSKSEVFEDFVISKNGDATLKVTSRYTGTCSDDARYYALTTSLYDTQESYKQFYQKYADDIDVLDTITYEDNEINNVFTTVEHYLLHKFWTASDSSKIIKKDFIPYALNSRLNYGEESKRKDPLKMAYPCNYSQTITISNDSGFNITDDEKIADNKFFSYLYISKIKNKKIELVYHFNSKVDVIYPSEYQNYKKEMDFINLNMVFSLEEKPIISDVNNFNWMLLLTILLAVIISVFGGIYLHNITYYTPYETRYDSIGGWLALIGFSVVLTPFIFLYSIIISLIDDFNINYFVLYFNAESANFSPLYGFYLVFASFINCLFFAFSVLLLVHFFKKKNTFRIYFLWFKIINLVVVAINVVIIFQLYGNSTNIEERNLMSKESMSLIRMIINFCIWVPYVWFSERSKHTFTSGNVFKE